MSNGNGVASVLETLRARLGVAKIEAEAARGRLTPEQREEADLRAQIAAAQDDARAADREAMRLALERREDAAADTLGPKIKIVGVLSDDGAHGFVLRDPGGKAFATWNRAASLSIIGEKDPKTKKPIDMAAADRDFALAAIYDWNGTIVEPGSDALARLTQLLDTSAGMAQGLALQARALTGAALETRKSGL